MKITLEPYSGGIYESSCEAEHISEVIMKFKGLLVTCGYHPRTVDECFNEHEVDSWFPEQNDIPKENDVTLPPEWHDEIPGDKKPITKSFSEKKKQIDSYLNNLYHDDGHVFEK